MIDTPIEVPEDKYRIVNAEGKREKVGGAFDVLERQLGLKQDETLKTPFGLFRQPTELPPMHSAQAMQHMVTVDFSSPVKEERIEKPFKDDEAILFVDKIAKANPKRKLAELRLDLSYANSAEHALEVLNSHVEKGTLTADEEALIVDILKKENSDTSHDDAEHSIPINRPAPPESSMEVSLDAIQKDLDVTRKRFAQELANFRQKSKSRQANVGKMMSDLGAEGRPILAVSQDALKQAEADYIGAKKRKQMAGEEDPLLEAERDVASLSDDLLETMPAVSRSIVTKSDLKWRNGDVDSHILLSNEILSEDVISNSELQTSGPIEHKLSTPQESFDGIEVEVPPPALAAPVIETKQEVVPEIKEQVFDVPFENGKLQIIQGSRESDNTVRILLDGRDFAYGQVDEKGVKVDLSDEEGVKKHGWFMAETIYERAFKACAETLKSLKMVK